MSKPIVATVPRPCAHCRAVFRPRRGKQRFCGPACQHAAVPPKPPTVQDVATRFWDKVAIGEPGQCWEWKAARLRSGGYGAFRVSGVTLRASRVAWTLTHGEPPGDMLVMHACDNPPCCNPAHLRLGTYQDNVDDKDRKGRGRNHAGPWSRKNWKEAPREGV